MIGKGMWMWGLIIFIFMTFSAFFYTILGDIVIFATAPTFSNLWSIIFDAGALVAATQWVIKNAIIALAAGTSSPLYSDFLLRAIGAGVLMTGLIIYITYLGLSKTIARKFVTGFAGFAGVLFVSVLIVGSVQVVTTLAMTGEFIWPFEGIVEIFKNGQVISDAFFDSSENIGRDSIFSFPGSEG